MLPKDVQDDAETRRDPVPALDLTYSGPATIETFSVVYDRDGAPAYGGVIGRTPARARVFGRVEKADADTLAALLASDRTPVGSSGMVTRASEDALQHWAVH
jgi:hypothetical protein